MKLILIKLVVLAIIFKTLECTVSLNLVAYLGQAIEFKCVTNETSKFTRIQHRLPNGTIETLLSNEYLNADYQKTEIRVEKYDHIYVVKINPVQIHSAGIYICEDDVSQQDKLTHNANITIHVKAPPPEAKQNPKQNPIKFAQYKQPKVPYQYGISKAAGFSITMLSSLKFLSLLLFCLLNVILK